VAHAKILVNQRRNEPSWRDQLGHQAVGLLDTIPGVARRTAEMPVAEVGTDMTRFLMRAIWPRGLESPLATMNARANGRRVRTARPLVSCEPPWCKRPTPPRGPKAPI
jgi:hypothetical protein